MCKMRKLDQFIILLALQSSFPLKKELLFYIYSRHDTISFNVFNMIHIIIICYCYKYIIVLSITHV